MRLRLRIKRTLVGWNDGRILQWLVRYELHEVQASKESAGRGVKMRQWLFIGCLFLAIGCARDKDEKPVFSGRLPGIPSQVVMIKQNILAGGQSNMTQMINGGRDGLATYFVQYLRRHGVEASLGLEAHGGSSQQDWTPGSPYYNALIAKGRTLGHVDLFIWWQGEAEGATMVPPLGQPQPMALAQSWNQTFTTFVAAVRRDLGQPDLPIIYCQIGDGLLGTDSWEEVRRQQSEVFIPNVYLVKTDGANFHGWFHTDEDGYRMVAERITATYLTNVH